MSEVESCVALDRLAGHRVVASVQVKRFARHARAGQRIVLQFWADAAALLLALALAGATAFQFSTLFLDFPFEGYTSRDLPFRMAIWSSLMVGLCIWFLSAGHYTIRRPLRGEMPKVFSALCIALLLDTFFQFATKSNFSRAWLVLVWTFAALTIPLARILVRRVLDWSGAWRLRAVIVGNGEHIPAVHSGLTEDRYMGYDFVEAECENWLAIQDRAELTQRIRAFAARNQLDAVIMVPSNEELSLANHLIDALNIEKIQYTIVPPITRLPLVGLDMLGLLNTDALLMTVRSGLLSPLRRVVKRVFDVAVSLGLLILLAPFLGLIALLVAADGGPILFGHERIGQDGLRFKCRKFRTMVPNAPAVLARLLESDPLLREEWNATFKLKEDPRITRIGRVLRKTSLDELPQLLNVVRGEMSLVGPRPVVANELAAYYGSDAMYYHLVRPGITGLWQVSGRSDLGYERRVHLDAWYVRNWTLWNDVVILFGTLPSVVRSRGAY